MLYDLIVRYVPEGSIRLTPLYGAWALVVVGAYGVWRHHRRVR